MTNEQLRLQMLSGIITESEYKAKLEESKSTKPKDSLNENFVGMGMVGNIFDRKKTDYELAFEHFLGSKYDLNEEVESSDIIDFVKQNFDKIKTNFYNAEKEAIMNDDYADQSDIDNLEAQLMGISTAEKLIDVINDRSIGVDLEGEEASKLFNMIKGYASLGEVKKANLNESALAIAGGIVLGALGLKAILRIMRGISSAVSLARMTDPKELKRSVEEIGKEAMQKGRNPLQIALWMMTVNSLIEKGEIKNGLSLAKTWGNIDKIDLEKVFSSSESGGVEEGKEVEEPNNY